MNVFDNKMEAFAAIWGLKLNEEFYAIINGSKRKFRITRDHVQMWDCVGWGPDWLNLEDFLVADMLRGKIKVLTEVEQVSLF